MLSIRWTVGHEQAMGKRLKFPWGEMRPAKNAGSPAASAEADSESGKEGPDSAKDLYALDVMRKRGLISEEDYQRRKSRIDASEPE